MANVAKTLLLAAALALTAAAAYGDAVFYYDVALDYSTPGEFLAAAFLALFFVMGEDIVWREDAAGNVAVAKGDASLMTVDATSVSVSFLSLFERRFVPVERERAEKVVTLYDFFFRRPLAVGDELALDYPLRDRTYHVAMRVAAEGALTLKAWPETPLRYHRVTGAVTGWKGDRAAAVDFYVGRDGALAGKPLRFSFKFTDWPNVTLTLKSYAVN